MTVAYFHLKSKKYLPNTAKDFDTALMYHNAYEGKGAATLVKVDDQTYRIRNGSGRLSLIELREVRIVGRTVFFKDEPPHDL